MLVLLVSGCHTDAPVSAPAEREVSASAPARSTTDARRELGEGIAALTAHEYQAGLELCEQALLHAGGDDDLRAEAYTWIIHGYAAVEDYEPSLPYFEPAVELLPDNVWLRYAQGVALGRVGRIEDALDALDHALELDPDHLKARQHRAAYRYESLEYPGAIEDCTLVFEVLDRTSDATLAQWSGDRAKMIRETLLIRAGCYDAIGEQELAEQDRERLLLNDR